MKKKKMVDTIKKLLVKFVSLFTSNRIVILESDSDLCDSTMTIYNKMIDLELDKKMKIYWYVNDVQHSKEILSNSRIRFISKRNHTFVSRIIMVFAKYCIYTHTFVGNRYNNKQIRVFVTHAAMPIKNSTGMFHDPNINTYILGTSTHCVYYRKKVLGDSNNYVITGLPRNDELFVEDKSIKEMLCGGLNYIVWMPTFKHHRYCARNDYNTDVLQDISILTKENMSVINQQLSNNNLFLIIKPHPSQDMAYFDRINYSNIKTITNDYLLDKKISVYNLLGNSSALITDFSSVFIDYLLVEKPIAFELGDLEKYEKGIGYVMNNPNDYLVGHKIHTLNDFRSFIEDVSKGNDIYFDRRRELCAKLHQYRDDESTIRLLRLLKIIDS